MGLPAPRIRALAVDVAIGRDRGGDIMCVVAPEGLRYTTEEAAWRSANRVLVRGINRRASPLAEISAGEMRRPTPDAPWRQRRWLLLAVTVGVVGLLGLLYWGMQRGPQAEVGKAVPLSGAAQDFTVTTLDGQTLRLSDLRGKTVVLNIWASWCVPCREEAGELNRSYELYKARNVAFVGIAFNDDVEPMRQFVSQYRVPYPVAQDTEGRISIGYGITGVPETYLIDPQGHLVKKWVGPVTAKQLNALITPLVP